MIQTCALLVQFEVKMEIHSMKAIDNKLVFKKRFLPYNYNLGSQHRYKKLSTHELKETSFLIETLLPSRGWL